MFGNTEINIFCSLSVIITTLFLRYLKMHLALVERQPFFIQSLPTFPLCKQITPYISFEKLGLCVKWLHTFSTSLLTVCMSKADAISESSVSWAVRNSFILAIYNNHSELYITIMWATCIYNNHSELYKTITVNYI